MPPDNSKKKVLLMGKSGSGKTSMRSVIFSNMLAKNTSRLGATMDVEHSHVVFMGGLKLNLWDCGGQENFLAHFISTQKSEIFKNVAVLIYVFDATTPFSFSDPSSSSGVEDERQAIQDEDGTGKLGRGKGTEWEKDVGYFEECLEALYSLAKEEHEEMYDLPPSSDSNEPSLVPPKVWVLINKMDLIGDGLPAKKLKMFQERRDDIERRAMEVGKRYGMKVGRGKGVRCFGTSIWDESLYKAWSSVIHTLIPNASLITSHLTHLRDISSCVEAVLFERQTFLVLAKSGSGLDADPEKGSGLLMGEEDEDVDGSGGFDEVELRGGAKGLERKRFEKISEVVKGFRTTCQKNGQPFINLEARFENASLGLDALTSNTYLMLVSSEPWVEPSLLMFNIEQARQHFEELSGDQVNTPCLICKTHPECKYKPIEPEDGSVEEWGHG